MLNFAWPLVLLLAPLPWLVWRWLPRAERREAALLMPLPASLETLRATETPAPHRRQRRRLWLLAPIWLLLLLAAARPQWVGEPLPLSPTGRDLLLAVDISGSMATEDMVAAGAQQTRLQAVKAVVADFVQRRSGDRLGLILFGTRAYTQVPLTFDTATFARLLDEAQIGFAGDKTAIGDAIGLAVKRLRARPAASRVLILLTDGANTAGQVQPLEAARVAAKAEVRLHSIGIGADEMQVRSLFGTRRVNPSRNLDEALLRQVAEITGGRYFRARDPQQLEAIYAELDRLEPLAQEAQLVRPQESLFIWPLGAALLVSLLWAAAFLHRSRRLGKPRSEVGA